MLRLGPSPSCAHHPSLLFCSSSTLPCGGCLGEKLAASVSCAKDAPPLLLLTQTQDLACAVRLFWMSMRTKARARTRRLLVDP